MTDAKPNNARPKGQRWTLLQGERLQGRRTLQGAAATLLRDLDAALLVYRRGTTLDERKGALQALTSCMSFILTAAQREGGGPKALRIAAAHAMIRRMGSALMELDAGIVDPILQPAPSMRKNRTREPQNVRLGRAAAAVALHGLQAAGMQVDEAAKFVATEIAGRPELDGIRREPWKAVKRWRQDMMGYKDRVLLDDLKHVPYSRSDVALFDEWAANIAERVTEGSWNILAAARFAQLTLLVYLPAPVPKKGGC